MFCLFACGYIGDTVLQICITQIPGEYIINFITLLIISISPHDRYFLHKPDLWHLLQISGVRMLFMQDHEYSSEGELFYMIHCTAQEEKSPQVGLKENALNSGVK